MALVRDQHLIVRPYSVGTSAPAPLCSAVVQRRCAAPLCTAVVHCRCALPLCTAVVQERRSRRGGAGEEEQDTYL
jgi:hypothetical protein